jgi:hypothetical protein
MMSDRAQACFAKFQENVARAARIEEKLPEDKAWSCVVRFYAALHLVNAYMIDKSHVRFDPASAEHTERKKAMDRCPELRDAPKRYRQLKDISESVRYDAGFKYSDEHHKDVKTNLDKIIAIVEPKIKKL